MADELIDILSENGTPTGEICLKSKAHQLGYYHASVHIWLYTRDKHILLQKRAPKKGIYPNLWDISVAGHVSSDETPIHAAIREVKEEIGLTIVKDSLLYTTKYLSKKQPTTDIYDNEFNHIYISELKTSIKSLKLQQEEVCNVQLITLEQLISDIKDPIKKLHYVPHGLKYYQLIEEILHTEFQNY